MTDRYAPSFVETFPTPMATGVLYISTEYSTCGHLCACGCGTEVVTPLSPAQWALTYYDGQDVSLWPSIGNWDLPCRAHYYIERGEVVWAKAYTETQVARNRARDRSALARLDDLLHNPTVSSRGDDGTTTLTDPHRPTWRRRLSRMLGRRA